MRILYVEIRALLNNFEHLKNADDITRIHLSFNYEDYANALFNDDLDGILKT